MYGSPFLFAACLSIPGLICAAGDTAIDRATLRGLKAIHVVIDPIHPELEQHGVTARMLQTRIEQHLKMAGIPTDSSALEFLAFKVIPAREKKGPYCVSITLSVYQPVVLARDGKIRTATDTWQVATLWVLQEKALYESVASAVDQLTGRFVEVYQAENPQGWRGASPAVK
jgi:hypothetical protein